MATIIPFPDRPKQPLKRSVDLDPEVAEHLRESGVDIHPGADTIGAAELFEVLQRISERAATAPPPELLDGEPQPDGSR